MGKGSQQIVTGNRFWGSFALAICFGPVHELLEISNGETVIWDGFIDYTSADGDGATVLNTDLGVVRFYWGSGTQNVDALLEGLVIDGVPVPMPAYRWVCYAVCEDLSFGQQEVPPTLLFHIRRRGVTDLSLSLPADHHIVEGDAILPEVIYDILTDRLYGLGVPTEYVDSVSFTAACEQTIEEGLVASPWLDDQEQAREFIGRILAYIDAVIYFDGGKFVIDLNRAADVSGAVSLTIADLLEEPKPTPSQFDETWNRTLVTFRDRENKWEETPEPYDDPANMAILQRKKTSVFNFPWVTRREVAKKIARFIGSKAGLPSTVWQLSLKPSFKTLRVGQLVKLTYAKLGVSNRILRIKRIRRGGPSAPEIEVTAIEERNRDIANDYIPSGDDFTVPGMLDPDGSSEFALTPTTPRLSWLPPKIKDDAGVEDGFLVAMNRPPGIVRGARVYWTWNSTIEPYKFLFVVQSFPAKGSVVSWHKYRGNWLFRVQLDTVADDTWLSTLRAEAPEIFAVVGVREFVTAPAKDEEQTLSPWLRWVPGGLMEHLTGTLIDIELEGGWQDTPDLSYEGSVTEGRYPTVHIYFGRVEDFAMYKTDALNFERSAGNHIDDAQLARYIKTPLTGFRGSETLDDVTAVSYDRDDVTMSPDGTYSRDWGARVPSTAELFDIIAGQVLNGDPAPDYALIEDIDEALGAIHAGTASPAQVLLAENIDDVLGQMLSTGSPIYNESP